MPCILTSTANDKYRCFGADKQLKQKTRIMNLRLKLYAHILLTIFTINAVSVHLYFDLNMNLFQFKVLLTYESAMFSQALIVLHLNTSITDQ